MDPNVSVGSADERCPKFTFKVKSHKDAFIAACKSTEHNNIHSVVLSAEMLLPFVRPIVNHSQTITRLCSHHLRSLITPVLAASPYLTQDIFQTISTFEQRPIPPPQHIYTSDIQRFYPSTPHKQILLAFSFYFPQSGPPMQLLCALLQFNFITDGRAIYNNMGNIGIPMGLPLAPELARLVTAHLLRNFTPPPGGILTLYFDDLAANFEIDTLPELESVYKLEKTMTDQTQDSVYNNETQSWLPLTRNSSLPIPLDPASFHSSRRLVANSYLGTLHRMARISTSPAQALTHALRTFFPALVMRGRDPAKLLKTFVEVIYFPYGKVKRDPPRPLPFLRYKYGLRRPTLRQLANVAHGGVKIIQNITKKTVNSVFHADYKFVISILFTASEKLLNYFFHFENFSIFSRTTFSKLLISQ